MSVVVRQIVSHDVRFPLQPGEGTDSVHSNPVYSYAVAEVRSEGELAGTGLVLTLGEGNDLVCSVIERLSEPLIGQEIEELMAGWGEASRRLANHPQLRWLGPHKGVVHLALASLTNALFDLWAKSRGIPLWSLLLNLAPQQVVGLLDLSGLEDELPSETALALLADEQGNRASREPVLKQGYPGYDTSVGWFHYSDEEIRERAQRAVLEGFTALKLKVGSSDSSRDLRRAALIREVAGPDVRLMLDVNQQWSLPQAIRMGRELSAIHPYWLEEPIHPDDVLGHQKLAQAIAPIPLALGEHVPNRVLFKNFMQAEAAHFVQADCTRVAGVSEFLTVSLLAKRFGLPVVPHVGDMGQIHQHLVLFNHIALGHEIVFLEYIPHLKPYFKFPAVVREGVYQTPEIPGSSSDLYDL
jgi:L-fuconate dehydratase